MILNVNDLCETLEMHTTGTERVGMGELPNNCCIVATTELVRQLYL